MKKKVRKQCPECNRAQPKHSTGCSRYDKEEKEEKEPKEPKNKWAEEEKWFEGRRKKSEEKKQKSEEPTLRWTWRWIVGPHPSVGIPPWSGFKVYLVTSK